MKTLAYVFFTIIFYNLCRHKNSLWKVECHHISNMINEYNNPFQIPSFWIIYTIYYNGDTRVKIIVKQLEIKIYYYADIN